jgi:uroporphyrinogen decarboxylase
MVRPLGSDEHRDCSDRIAGLTVSAPRRRGGLSNHDRSDVNRLLKVLQHHEADRVPHLEFWVTSKSVYEYTLERELKDDVVEDESGGQSITPEDHVEFAMRLGMDAVACDFSWRLNHVLEQAADGSVHHVGDIVKTWADLDDLEPPPSLAGQLSTLERYLRAAQGTGVGVIANFSSFFESAVLAVGGCDFLCVSNDNRSLVEKLMDILLHHQEKVMRVVCDRFADALAFVMVNDNIAHDLGLVIPPDVFMEIFPHRMKRLIAAAKEHGKLVAVHTGGKMNDVLPILRDIGFDAVHPIETESNDIFELKAEWAGEMALVGNIPTALLAHGSKEEIEERVREYCVRLAPGGGYVLSSSNGIVGNIPPQNFVAMTQAVHKYGRYGSLGRET